MMFRSVYLKTLFNLRGQILGWSVGLGLIVFVTMAFFNSFNQNGIENIVNSVPDSLKAVVGSVDDFKTVSGYIGQQVFGPNGYILAMVASILIALGITASEEDDKRLQTLLSLPVTRSAVFCQKWLAVITAIAAISLAVVIGLYLGLLVVGHSADGGRIAASVLAFFLMNSAFATIAFSVALFTGKKGLSIVLASSYTGACFIISSLAPAVDKLHIADMFSLLHYYNNPLIMQHGLNLTHIAVLCGVIVVAGTIGWLRFRQRNVGV